MPVITYREHLDYFEKYRKTSISFLSGFLTLFIVAAFAFAASTFLLTYNNKKLEPANVQNLYFDTAGTSFFKSRQSLGELASSFQVAGAKTENINIQSESSQSATLVPGFFITLGDTQKAIIQIKGAQDNIKFQQDSLKNIEVPQIYQSLDSQLDDYFQSTYSYLENLEKTQNQLKDLLLVAGPDFYLPVLSDEPTWQSQDIEKIKAYYSKKGIDAQKAEDAFSKIEVLPQLKNYKNMQLSYFQLVINVCDNVTKVLDKQSPPEEDLQTPSTIEEAYQVLVGAKRDNEIIAQRLLTERVRLTSTEDNLNRLAIIRSKEQIIESGFSQSNRPPDIKTIGH